jgi:ribosomal protein S18 acetylase RimI-like enzyme
MSVWRKAVAVLRDSYRSMSGKEFLAFLRLLLFRNDEILIYCSVLSNVDAGHARTSGPLIVKGHPPDLELEKKERHPVPWELQCDIYDGVRDFFIYREGDRVGHVAWLYYRGDPNRILRLDEGDCEIKFCLTLPEFRGRGLYPAALLAIQVYLKDRGFHRCFICVKSDNRASIKGIEKAGFHRVGVTRLQKVMGVQVSARRLTQRLGGAAEQQRWIA